MEKILFTSESVTEGHPDKICDAISDAILDALIEKDPMSRVACETSITTGLVLVMGEITTQAYIDIPQIVRETLRNIGYTRGKYGFDADTCGVITCIDEQSKDIAQGVNEALEVKEQNECENAKSMLGAGDQGMMFGYATNETDEFMPYAISLAHKLARQLAKVRKNGTLAYLRPDGKTQVTVEYNEQGKPVRLEAVVLSTQHDPEISQEQIQKDIKHYVFDCVLPQRMVDSETKFYVNPTGRFVIGGPHGDSGIFAIVTQVPMAMNGTIRENVDITNTLTDEEIYHYLDLVELKDDIEKFPLGLNTFVGENGQNISGGQKQRIAIARALALKPEVIIFDEATSNLDPLTERRICNNLKQLHITQIVVTHRLNAIQDADTIYVVEKGKIIESGTHVELLQLKGAYYDSVNN